MPNHLMSFGLCPSIFIPTYPLSRVRRGITAKSILYFVDTSKSLNLHPCVIFVTPVCQLSPLNAMWLLYNRPSSVFTRPTYPPLLKPNPLIINPRVRETLYLSFLGFTSTIVFYCFPLILLLLWKVVISERWFHHLGLYYATILWWLVPFFSTILLSYRL